MNRIHGIKITLKEWCKRSSCITASFTNINQGHIFCQLGKLFISYPGEIREQNVHASFAHAADFVSRCCIIDFLLLHLLLLTKYLFCLFWFYRLKKSQVKLLGLKTRTQVFILLSLFSLAREDASMHCIVKFENMLSVFDCYYCGRLPLKRRLNNVMLQTCLKLK